LINGQISSAEIKQLEERYVALGLDKSLVTSDIHNVISNKLKVKNLDTNQAIITSKDNVGFILDEKSLLLHESETEDAQNMLGNIFIEEETQNILQNSESTSFGQNIDGLDFSHSNLYQELTVKDKWAKKEVIELCNKLKLMVDGAIETINDWSFCLVDAPVLEDRNGIFVDIEIVEELKRIS
jgi:hypothetical protein